METVFILRKQPVRVALFVHRYPPATGGAELYAERLAKFHQSCGDEVDAWTSTALDLSAMTGPGRHLAESRGLVKRYRPLVFPGRRYLFKALSLLPMRNWQCLTRPANPISLTMWRDAGRLSACYDAVHALAFPHSAPAACGLRLARRLKVPFAITPFLHLGDPDDANDRTRRQYTSPPLAWLLRQADVIFAQTALERDAVLNIGVPSSRVIHQGLGVEATECTGGDRDAARKVWGATPDRIVIGHLANLSIEKGSVDLLAAVSSLANPPSVVLAGPEMPNFARTWDARRYPTVTKLGPLSDMQKRDFFAGIDVLCLPSRSDSFGLVLLEAWANAKPVVVYRAGGPAELVRDGINGVQVRCRDIRGLACALTRLSSEGALRNALGRAGRARIDAGDFEWGRSLAIVRNALASGPDESPGTRPQVAESAGL